MKLLLIETCGATGTIALADSTLDQPITDTATLPGRAASEQLVAAIRDLTGTALHNLDAIAVVSGPGSFTGVRVGLAAAKGLCHALDLPLVAVSRLALLARSASAPPDTSVFALLDAGRSEFYLGIYCDGIALRETLVTHDQLTEAIAQHDAPALIICETALAQSLSIYNLQQVADPTAEDAYPPAILRLLAHDFDDLAASDANYIRRTDAEIFAKRSSSSDPAMQTKA